MLEDVGRLVGLAIIAGFLALVALCVVVYLGDLVVTKVTPKSVAQRRLDERLRQAEREIREAERKHPRVSYAFDNFLGWVAFAALAMWLAARYC